MYEQKKKLQRLVILTTISYHHIIMVDQMFNVFTQFKECKFLKTMNAKFIKFQRVFDTIIRRNLVNY